MSQDWYLSAAEQKAAELEMELSAAKTDLLRIATTKTFSRQARPFNELRT